jgi:hypothetical protein
MNKTYSSWLKSLTAKLKFEKQMELEAEKIFRSGGRITVSRSLDKHGNNVETRTLVFGSYKPKIKMNKKNLAKLGIFVDEAKDKEIKRKKRKKEVDNEA